MDYTGLNFNRKNILVTGGGGTGVGAGVCKVLSEMGAMVIVNEPDKSNAKKAASKYKNAIPISADISIESEVNKMFEEISNTVGQLHGLVNNAGVGLSKMAHEVSTEEFDRLYNVDIKGVWMVSKTFVQKLLKDQNSGNIVNISSVQASATMPRFAVYSSAKSAVEGLTRGMAVELGRFNTRVNAIGPGYVHAEQNYKLISTWSNDPEQWKKDVIDDHQVLNFEIQPEDCGNVAAFLLSDFSRAITGQTINVDAGTTNLLYSRLFTEK